MAGFADFHQARLNHRIELRKLHSSPAKDVRIHNARPIIHLWEIQKNVRKKCELGENISDKISLFVLSHIELSFPDIPVYYEKKGIFPLEEEGDPQMNYFHECLKSY